MVTSCWNRNPSTVLLSSVGFCMGCRVTIPWWTSNLVEGSSEAVSGLFVELSLLLRSSLVVFDSSCWDGNWVLWEQVVVWISWDGICVPLSPCGESLSMPVLDVELFVGCSSVGVSAFCPVELCAHWFRDAVLWTLSCWDTPGVFVCVLVELLFCICSLWWGFPSRVWSLVLTVDDPVVCRAEFFSMFWMYSSRAGGFEGLILFYCWTIVMAVVRSVLLFCGDVDRVLAWKCKQSIWNMLI